MKSVLFTVGRYLERLGCFMRQGIFVLSFKRDSLHLDEEANLNECQNCPPLEALGSFVPLPMCHNEF